MNPLSYLALAACVASLSLAVAAWWFDRRSVFSWAVVLSGVVASLWNFGLVFGPAAAPLGYLVFSLVLGWGSLVFAGVSRGRLSLLMGAEALVLAMGSLWTPWGWWPGQLIYLVALFVAHRKRTTERQRRSLGRVLVAFALFHIAALGFIFNQAGLLAVVVVALSYVLLRQQPVLPLLEQHLHEVVTDALWIFDKTGQLVGTNALANRFSSPQTLREFAGLWERASRHEACSEVQSSQLDGQSITWTLAPHYDRFGDFLGAVAVVKGLTVPTHKAENLSPREQEIVDLINQGCDNAAIAERLFLSVGTVKRHLNSIFKKTGVERREQLIKPQGA